jgi:N-acyl-D-aspartate/D-glutamate deacylase
VSHLKVIGRQPHTSGKITDVLRMLDTARRDGTDVAFDCYPYTWGSTVLSALMPPWAMTEGMAGLRRQLASDKGRFRLRSAIEDDASTWENWVWACGWEAIRIAAVKGGHPSGLVGRSLSQIACDCHRPPFDVLCDILMEEGAGAMMVFEMMRETDMLTALTHPMGMVGTDAIPCPPGQGHPHPRGYGTFAGILGHWVRDRKVLTLEGAVRKMSALPARRFKVAERGLLAEGYYADLVVFNPHTVAATATIEDPRRFPIGIDHVIVNGAVALSNAEPTGELSGQFLVRAGSMIQP